MPAARPLRQRAGSTTVRFCRPPREYSAGSGSRAGYRARTSPRRPRVASRPKPSRREGCSWRAPRGALFFLRNLYTAAPFGGSRGRSTSATMLVRDLQVSGVAAFEGSFDAGRAERLLWRAGFGPRKGEAEALAQLGLDGAVRSLTRPANEKLVGAAPVDEKGRALAPYDAWGHDHVWWLDRMVRTSRPLVERMTLVWHDWFATSNGGVGSQRLMLNQNQLFRQRGLGTFHTLLLDVTKDPAMLL